MFLVDENGSTLVPVPRDGPLDEVEASSLTAWAQGYQDVRKHLRDSVTGRGHCKPESGRSTKRVPKLCSDKKKSQNETETSAHRSGIMRKNTVQRASQGPN